MVDGVRSLRVATPSDGEAVTAVLESAYPALMAPAYDPEVLASILPSMVKANPALLASGSYYVGESPEGAVVACGGWTVEAPGTGTVEPGFAHLRHFGTRADQAGKGWGRAVFARCRDGALAEGIHTLLCLSSLNAEPFYRALGFETVERLDTVLRNGKVCPTLAMRRPLGRDPEGPAAAAGTLAGDGRSRVA